MATSLIPDGINSINKVKRLDLNLGSIPLLLSKFSLCNRWRVGMPLLFQIQLPGFMSRQFQGFWNSVGDIESKISKSNVLQNSQ